MTENTLEKLRRLVVERLDINRQLDELDADVPILGGGLNLDSLALVGLVSLTEQCFEIEFGEDELNMDSFASLRSLARVISEMRARSPQTVAQ
jgi:acyl carrier protein